MAILAFIAVFAIMPHLQKGTPYRKLITGVLALGVLSPWITFEVFVPRKFEATANSKWIDYEFADHDYALEFAACNCDAVIRMG